MSMRGIGWMAVVGLAFGAWASSLAAQGQTSIETGVVMLEVAIGPRGNVLATIVLESPSVRLAAAAVQEVRAHAFAPPERQGKPVRLETMLAVTCIVRRGADGRETVETSFSNEVLVPATLTLPDYPDDALVRRLSGWVDFELQIAPDGTVARSNITGSEPRGIFDAAAEIAIRQSRFRTDRVDGVPVGRRGTYRFEFEPAPADAPGRN